MAIQIGSRVGAYEVTALLGKGGMGEVYRARDARLNRDVALKVLLDVYARDPERMARFEREAQLLASLNHPNIAALYGLEESGGVRALVMELVEGDTLADKLTTGAGLQATGSRGTAAPSAKSEARPLPLEEALPIARQIVDALEAAHDRGIIHRDLKPANIKVTRDGTVKVLDFGLAKVLADDLTSGDLENSPTMSLAATRAGAILGTAAYMSPEQAKGRSVDRRADIWAFGVVFAEMLTGSPLYGRETVLETLASVVRDEPVLPDVPPRIRTLLRRCLEKDPRRRLQAIGEARLVLEDPAAGEQGPAIAAAAAPPRWRTLLWAASVALTALVAGATAWMLAPAPPEPPLRKFDLPVEKLQVGLNWIPKISPDGKKLVYASGQRLWVRDLGQIEPRELVAAGDPTLFFWSPDSTQVGYMSDGKLWKVPATGGQPTVITVLRQQLGNGIGIAWEPGGRIVIATAAALTGLQEVSAEGGDPKTLLAPKSPDEQDFHDVSLLPDGKGLLYIVDRGASVFDTISLFSSTVQKEILKLPGESLRSPLYSPTGHILYVRTTNNPGIWALPFSLATLASTGNAFLVAPQGTLPSVSQDGTLSLIRQVATELRELVWVDRAGKVEGAIGQPQRGLAAPALSPDGRRVAAVAAEGQKRDVWVTDVARGTHTKLTFTDDDEVGAAWSPSGDLIFLETIIKGDRTIVSQRADGTGQTQTLMKGSFPAVSRDGKFLAFTVVAEKTGPDIAYVALEGERPSTSSGRPEPVEGRKPVVFLEATANQIMSQFSPDGRHLAYLSAESGRPEVYIKPFPSGDGKWQVSLNTGTFPRWNRMGDKLLYLDLSSNLMEVDVVARPSLTLSTPRLLFSAASAGLNLGTFDIAPDGKRFLFVREAGSRENRPPAITLVENWFAEFKNRK